jgi:hypothetical protein
VTKILDDQSGRWDARASGQTGGAVVTRVIVAEDCRNSPKNLFLQELTIALVKGDAKFILGRVTDDIRWDIVGDELIEGKDDLARAVGRLKNEPTAELTLNHLATHGKTGAVDGTTKLKNGRLRAFCDVYEFDGAKGARVKEITSYLIEIG